MMTISKYIKQMICGSILFPLSNSLLKRKGIMSMYRKALEAQKMSQELIQKIQLKKIQEAIRYADTYVPFYKRRFASIGLQPGDINNFKDIEGIPLLTRQDVIENYIQLVDIRYQNSIIFTENPSSEPIESVPFARFKKPKLIKNTSGGSRGEPNVFYENGVNTAINLVHELRIRQWFNVKPGAKEVRLTRAPTDCLPNSMNVRLREILWNQLLLPGVNISELENQLNFHKISYFQPDVIWGFTSSLTNLAQHMLNNKLKFSTYRPKVCITRASPLFDHERELIEKVFHCPVTNIYGNREVGNIAGLCPHGSMHINQEAFYIETDKNGGEFSEIDDGEIIATTLEQSPMPLIRYRMGDIGKITDSSCSCGMNLQVLKMSHKRAGKYFIKPKISGKNETVVHE